MIRQKIGELHIATERQGLLDLTPQIAQWARDRGLREGLLTIFCRHTSASLLIQENAASEARADIEAYFRGLAPENPGAYTHDEEGPDDMPAHLRAALTQVHLSIPVAGDRLALGTWQGIYLFEHRKGNHRRSLALHFLGVCD